jgi:hypothetical protein
MAQPHGEICLGPVDGEIDLDDRGAQQNERLGQRLPSKGASSIVGPLVDGEVGPADFGIEAAAGDPGGQRRGEASVPSARLARRLPSGQ